MARSPYHRYTARMRVLSGIQPSGQLHLGNYFGSIKPNLELQGEADQGFFFIADLHALTTVQKGETLRKAREEIVLDYLGCGFDPAASVIFCQSQVPQHTELMWILSTVTPMGLLERAVSYKEKVEKGVAASAGLFTYPVLMAADILLYRGTAVPVGEDQRQHLEIAREIARTFNARFGETFAEPEGIWSTAPRIMSITDPTQKMSKSLPQGCLFLTDDDETVREKVKRAVTDSGSEVRADRTEKPAIWNLLTIYAAMAGKSVEEVAKEHAGSNYLVFKEALAETINATLAPFRERKRALAEDRASVMAVLRRGAEKAQSVASTTLDEVQERVGLI